MIDLRFNDGSKVNIAYPITLRDVNGNETYCEDSNGNWVKYEYNANGKITYYENSYGQWTKREYDDNGNETYYEDFIGTKTGQSKHDIVEMTIADIEKIVGHCVKVIK